MSANDPKRATRPHPRLSAIGATADKYERRLRVGQTARRTHDVTVRQMKLLPLATGYAIVSCKNYKRTLRRDQRPFNEDL